MFSCASAEPVSAGMKPSTRSSTWTAITCWSPVCLQPFAIGVASARSAERPRKRCDCWSMNRRSRRDPFLCTCTNVRERTIAWS